MYQGEVNIEERELHSFLEAAEDLDIRCLSNREIPFEPTHQDIAPSPKRMRAAEKQQK